MARWIEPAWALPTFESLRALRPERHASNRTAEVRGSNPLGSTTIQFRRPSLSFATSHKMPTTSA